MSGQYCRSPYDECFFTEYNNRNRPHSDYPMLLESYVNPNMSKASCDTSECNVCEANKDATLTNMPDDFANKTEIDSALRGIGRPLSYCNTHHFLPCDINSPNRLPGECNNNITITPLLCERSINPTNMKMQF